MPTNRAILVAAIAWGCSARNAPGSDAPLSDAAGAPDSAGDGPGISDARPIDASTADAPSDAATACVGSLASCSSGTFFADCGGAPAAAPALGCNEAGDCLWFAHACAPTGYALSRCDASSICCENNWPFADQVNRRQLDGRFYALGTLPWDRARAMTVAVTTDSGLPRGNGGFVCAGTDPFPAQIGSPCSVGAGAAVHDAQVRGDILSFGLLTLSGTSGWYPVIDVDLAARPVVGRACTYRYTDVGLGYCPAETGAHCAVAGSLILSQLPATDEEASHLAGRLDVTIDQLHLTAAF